MVSRCNYQNSYFVLVIPGLTTSEGTIPVMLGYSFSSGTLSHELGHNMAGLRDEYLGTYTCTDNTPALDNPENYLNVYRANRTTNDKESCIKYASWKDIVGSCALNGHINYSCSNYYTNASCFLGAGCSTYHWRPASNTIMKDSNQPLSAVDVRAFCRIFVKYMGIKIGICDEL